LDYFKQRRAFRALLTDEIKLSMGQNVLYRELLDYANDTGKLDSDFGLWNDVLARRSSQSVAGLKKNRNALVQKGLIKLTPGSKDKTAPRYQIIKLYVDYKTEPKRVEKNEKSSPHSTEKVAHEVATRVAHEVAHKNLLLPDNDLTKEHSPAPAKPAPKKASVPDPHSADYKAVVEYLNEKTDSHYQASGAKTRELIHARLNSGFGVDDFKRVIDNKAAEWMGTEMQKYLRPSTLFGPKFEEYLNQQNVRPQSRSYQERDNPNAAELPF
jgi:uncharacterized phage protein (TIGR02220 family)